MAVKGVGAVLDEVSAVPSEEDGVEVAAAPSEEDGDEVATAPTEGDRLEDKVAIITGDEDVVKDEDAHIPDASLTFREGLKGTSVSLALAANFLSLFLEET